MSFYDNWYAFPKTDQAVAEILLPFASHAEKIMVKPNEGTNTSYNHNFKIVC